MEQSQIHRTDLTQDTASFFKYRHLKMNHTCLIRTLPKILSPLTVKGSRSAREDDVTVYINKGSGAQIRSRKPVSSLLKFSNYVYFLTRLGSLRTGQGINRNIDKKKVQK